MVFYRIFIKCRKYHDDRLHSFFSATLRMAGALEKSGEVMKYMQQLVKVPEIQATMNEMSKEMMKVQPGCMH